MYSNELETAISAARKAGERIMQLYGGALEIFEKSENPNVWDPVTEADHQASDIIISVLEKAFPHDAIISEERKDEAHTRVNSGRVWIIDPIDGTKGFIHKNGDFAVQIALVENGEPVAGVVFEPAHNALYSAAKNQGCFLEKNGDKTRVKSSEITNLSDVTIAVSRDHRSGKMSEIIENFGLKGEVSRGSVGVKIGLIARRECDLYIHLSPRTMQWDSAAPEIIIREAGGELTDLFGDKISYNTADIQNHNGLVASNAAIHAEIIEKLRPLLAKFGRPHIKK